MMKKINLELQENDIPINKSISRAFDILNLFNSNVSELKIAEIARKIGANKSTTSRLVSTLQSLNYLRKCNDSSKYCLGIKVAELAKAYYANLDLKQLVQPYLKELNEKTNELVSLGIVDGDRGFYLAWLESTNQIKMVIEQRDIYFPLHAGAPGKLLLAYLPDERVEEIIKRTGLPRYTERTITNRDDLAKEIGKIRKEGFSVSQGEHIDYGYTVSVPVRDCSGRVIAALSISWVAIGNTSENEDKYGALVKETARKISRELGFQEYKFIAGGG